MFLIHLLLPLNDNSGKRHKKSLFRTVAGELIERFGGLTAYTRAPAEGLWKEASETDKDKIVIYEVMIDRLDAKWWRKYRHRLEKRFKQKQLIVRSQEIRIL